MIFEHSLIYQHFFWNYILRNCPDVHFNINLTKVFCIYSIQINFLALIILLLTLLENNKCYFGQKNFTIVTDLISFLQSECFLLQNIELLKSQKSQEKYQDTILRNSSPVYR